MNQINKQKKMETKVELEELLVGKKNPCAEVKKQKKNMMMNELHVSFGLCRMYHPSRQYAWYTTQFVFLV